MPVMLTSAGAIPTSLDQLNALVYVRDCWHGEILTQHARHRSVAQRRLQAENCIGKGMELQPAEMIQVGNRGCASPGWRLGLTLTGASRPRVVLDRNSYTGHTHSPQSVRAK